MHLNTPTVVIIVLDACAAILSTPVLYQGFRRRGKGVFYQKDFLIQRAPQLLSLLNMALIFVSFIAFNGLFHSKDLIAMLLSLGVVLPGAVTMAISYLGILVFISGLIFMIGGWYSLGEAFSTDAELLEGQTVRRTGLLKFVMHPAYSGIIQSLVGASLAAVSPASLLLAIFGVAPLWLNRAKYEERLLIQSFGSSYEDYARDLKWRRLVPGFFPIGV